MPSIIRRDPRERKCSCQVRYQAIQPNRLGLFRRGKLNRSYRSSYVLQEAVPNDSYLWIGNSHSRYKN